MKHTMKLRPNPFRMILCGEKTYELRLYDEKRQCIKIGDKSLSRSLIIFLIIITHAQHIQRFFRFIRSFKNSNQFVQQSSRTVILSFCKIVFSGFVLVFVIGAFQQFIILPTWSESSCRKQSYNDIFLHPILKYCAKLLIRREFSN